VLNVCRSESSLTLTESCTWQVSVARQSMLPRKRSLDEHYPASEQLCVSRQFLDRVWFELEDVHSSGFPNAALSCEPFLRGSSDDEENCARVESKSIASTDETSCGVSEHASDDGSDATLDVSLNDSVASDIALNTTRSCSPRSSSLVYEPGDEREVTRSSKSSRRASSRKSSQTSIHLPCIKGRPVGVTGFRLIHVHTFQTRNGKYYHGFNLKFPDKFGLKTAKSKDLMDLVCKRNRMLETWAMQNTSLTKAEIAEWITEIDKLQS